MVALVPAAGADALHGFTQFGVVHGLVVCGCLALFATIVWLGRRLGDERDELRARKALAIFALLYWLAYNTWWNWNGLDLTTGLPLQACDISGLVAPFALLALSRWLRSTLYFWAFAFATQAFIQPTLTEGPAHPVFWAFWMAHVVIIACALYDLVVVGFRPDWSDFARAAIVCLAWAALALAVDIRLGANYGYVGNPPAGVRIPPLIEAFGPWPQRLVVIAALAALAFLLALAPWLVVRRLRGQTEGSASSATSGGKSSAA